ncbi:MAG: hypothetical protein WAN17_20290 [Candidatus Sulfotelmatobacter sp.]|jgi:hypothetical protein
MKQGAILLLLMMTVMLGGCGSTPTSVQTGAGGIWLAELTGGTGQASGLSFITDFTVNGNSTLNILSFQFLNYNPNNSANCFSSINGPNVSGSLPLTVQTNDTVTGNITYTVASGGNTLTLNGTVSGTASQNGSGTSVTYTLTSATITGTWTLKGSAECTVSGDTFFTMTQS